MGYVIGAILVIIIVYYLVVYVIAPIAGVLGMIALSIGVLYAFGVSISSFVSSLKLHINPYTTYVDNNPKAVQGTRRSYFFGPGYHQIAITVKDAFSNQAEYMETIKTWWKGFRPNHGWIINIWVDIFYIAACICTYVFGTIWTVLFSSLLFGVIFTGMCGFYVFFTLLWLGDRITLMVRSIQSRCPNCKRISIVPVFNCPDCGAQHQNLTPGPYGILTQKCACGKKLPTTIFNGRSQLEALCPYCQTSLAASDAKQFGIQLVGGVSAGKTTFLASYWHHYIEQLKSDKQLEFTCFPEEAFDELEYWYQNGLSLATSETNATMYSIVHKREGSIPIQMTIYDVAGESFTNLSADIQQQQFRYCEGIVIVIDPTATPELNSDTISGFVSEFKQLKGIHSSQLAQIPVAVIISKADLFKRELGVPKIKSIYNQAIKSSEMADITLNSIRNDVCRSFLLSHGFDGILNMIDSEFENTQYFSVSAMGHEAEESSPYEPWGVIEPISWLTQQAGVQL